MTVAGKLVGVGVGPGDPELITLKALRLLRAAALRPLSRPLSQLQLAANR